jgi:hypothetical protein
MATKSFPNQSGRVSIEAYHTDVYNQLNVFSTSKALLPKYKQSLTCLGNVIVRNKLHDRFGISLLHKHFDLCDDEILLRRINIERNCAYMEPTKYSGGAIPYLWKPVRNPQGQWSFFPLEYLQPLEKASVPRSYLTGLSPFLVEMANTLEALGVLDLFSIVEANLTKIRLRPDEILVETTDSEKRRLDLKPAHSTAVDYDELTETFWMFSPTEDSNGEPSEGPTETTEKPTERPTEKPTEGPPPQEPTEMPTEKPTEGPSDEKALGVCSGQHCLGHCKSHCKSHCKAHCLDHKLTVAALKSPSTR